ncbi:hypothetical protein RR42_s2916 [Cupriavidus basilensis]|uniref:Uncharacterized protein n=1 Tax=Cupriavidus basilensis TaxID=68895 RepID=A0A0C4YFC1_9BURK|nr:hypothetical protein RR42_s2916 [Cupriavidus basilensis]
MPLAYAINSHAAPRPTSATVHTRSGWIRPVRSASSPWCISLRYHWL